MKFHEIVTKYLLGSNEERLAIMQEWEKTYPVIYRYRAIDEDRLYEFEALEKGDIYCSSFDKLNDDDEGIILRELIANCPKEIMRQTTKKLKDMRKQYGVSCFTEVGPQDVHSDYMWDNYALGSKGICIQYRFQNLIENNLFVIPITYANKIHFESFRAEGTFLADLAYATKHRIGRDKDGNRREWFHEQEWRHIEKLKEGAGIYCGVNIVPEKIYCGKKLDKNYIQRIKDMYPSIVVEL